MINYILKHNHTRALVTIMEPQSALPTAHISPFSKCKWKPLCHQVSLKKVHLLFESCCYFLRLGGMAHNAGFCFFGIKQGCDILRAYPVQVVCRHFRDELHQPPAIETHDITDRGAFYQPCSSRQLPLSTWAAPASCNRDTWYHRSGCILSTLFKSSVITFEMSCTSLLQ